MHDNKILLCVPLLLGLSSCTAAPDEAALRPEIPRDVEVGDLVQAPISEQWVGHELGFAARQWRVHGRFDRAAAGDSVGVVPSEPVRRAGGHDTTDDELDSQFVIGDPKTGLILAPDFLDEELAMIADELANRGYAEGDDADPAHEGPTGFRGYTGGVDTRVPRGLYEYGLTSSSYNRIGKLTSGCTASLIGTPETDYYIITASHCYWNGAGQYLAPDFEPRRDGCKRPSGQSIRGCDPTPYGTWDGGQFMMSQFYIDNCTTDAGFALNQSACRANDIAVQRVTRPPGVDFPGAFGFGAYTRATLDAATLYHRGYPACSLAPASCRTNTLMGDTQDCSVPFGESPDGSGWDRIMAHGCDATAGDSGAPLYHYDGGAKVAGVHTLGNNGTTGPNRFRRITPQFYGWMLNFMGL